MVCHLRFWSNSRESSTIRCTFDRAGYLPCCPEQRFCGLLGEFLSYILAERGVLKRSQEPLLDNWIAWVLGVEIEFSLAASIFIHCMVDRYGDHNGLSSNAIDKGVIRYLKAKLDAIWRVTVRTCFAISLACPSYSACCRNLTQRLVGFVTCCLLHMTIWRTPPIVVLT